jgi:hypothetical protein
VAEALHQIGAAIPLIGFCGIRFVLALGEEQSPPADNQRAVVIGKPQIMRLVLQLHGRHRLHEGEDRVAVGPGDLGVGAERHCRIQQAAVRKASRVQRRIELIRGPFADAGVSIGRDIRGIERAERRGHRASTREQLAARCCVAGDAVAGLREIFSARDDRRLVAGGGLALGGGLRCGHHEECQRSEHCRTSEFVEVRGHRDLPLNSVRCHTTTASTAIHAMPAWGWGAPGATKAMRPRP